jgi:Xaa-Pro aminopeptidase
VIRLGNITDKFYVPFRPSRRGGVGNDLKFVEKIRRTNPAVRIENLSPVLDRHQWQKAAKDIEIMRHAVDITVDAFMESARLTRPGRWEYEIEALIDFIFRRRGSQRAAFIIVGSGPNSCMLHHMDNDRQMEENELLVLDIGTVFCQVATDLTRTIPVSGKFTEEQRRIYDIVLEANKKAISIVKPGVTLAEIHKTAFDIIDEYGYGQYFIHGTCHTLNGGGTSNPLTNGLYREAKGQARYSSSDAPLVPGSMFTIEPGIYIPEKALGIRIEDDILVTEEGYEVLTKAAPKEAEEIESLMGEALKYLKEPGS